MDQNLDCRGRPIMVTLSPAASIRIWCPKPHTRRHGDGSIIVDPRTGEPVSPEMVWDQCAHGWVCQHVYRAGERGKHPIRCSIRYALGYAFADENASVLLELARPVHSLKLSSELLYKVSHGEAIVPWMVDVISIPDPVNLDREFDALMRSSRNVVMAHEQAA